ncbi:MAG: hypothetical protein J0J15_21585 [Mesorhizobium sp.]|nr:hypothetical protein [Mesorhizobium sp.]
MSRVLACLLRLAVILLGYATASLAASAFLHVILFAWAGFEPNDAPPLLAGPLVFSVPVVALFVAYFGFVPSVVIILIGEVLGRHDWLTYAIGGGAVAAIFLAFVSQAPDAGFTVLDPRMMATVVGTGRVAGIAYWLVAGRSAGAWRF